MPFYGHHKDFSSIQLSNSRMDNAQMEALVKDSMRDVYLVGAGIGLAWVTQFLR